MKDQPVSKNFGAIIDRTLKIIKANYQKAFIEVGVDLTTEQWVLMDSLFKNNGISQNDLANGSFKNAPTVSRILDLMCKKGLTERRRFENDRRRYKIFLTQFGEETYKKALPVVIDLRLKGWKNLSEEDYQHFTRIMDQVFSNFEQG
ncbi:MAG: MarR family winged helix-turn-helix transcriptional regulator [Saprospiraceae bacterium]|jgi:DNA-binding MarR family transcriptional regulator